MGMSANNHCVNCGLPVPVGVSECPLCAGKCVNFAGSSAADHLSLSGHGHDHGSTSDPSFWGDLLSSTGDIDWTDLLLHHVGLVRIALNFVPTQKLRTTGWQGTGDLRYVRVMLMHIKTGWGRFFYGPMVGVTNATETMIKVDEDYVMIPNSRKGIAKYTTSKWIDRVEVLLHNKDDNKDLKWAKLEKVYENERMITEKAWYRIFDDVTVPGVRGFKLIK
ncbi:hypothetical protein QBC47DRAFT_388993 [Echria macrotheca]|uniref:Uncharacterized protein n=1 Tax=Echria macrotheca TaxID=438768 RepID=A0AAJ0B6K6_9PEZI|nr:hypothetical protein QBC47DRAFT_388993 [Echria macrotheca]